MNKNSFWLEGAKLWRKSEQGWLKTNQDDPETCARNAAEYAKMAERSEAGATKAPVKVILVFEDGTQEVWE